MFSFTRIIENTGVAENPQQSRHHSVFIIKKIKIMKKLIIPFVAILMALSFSAFTSAKRATSNFYVYTSGSLLQSDIQNINNYVASSADPCSGSDNVCGVTLNTARNVGQTPVSTEFNAEKANLWSSQQNHAAQDGNIGMKQ